MGFVFLGGVHMEGSVFAGPLRDVSKGSMGICGPEGSVDGAG